MKVRYDATVDVLRLILDDAFIEESDEVSPGVILDHDASGKLVGIEILNASETVSDPNSLQFSVLPNSSITNRPVEALPTEAR